MNHNDTDEMYGENRAEGMSADEIREKCLEMLANADGALIVTANVVDDDGDGESDSVEGAVAKFVGDDLDGGERGALNDALERNLMGVVMGVGGRAEPDEGDLADLHALGELLSAIGQPEDDDGEDDGYGPSMFA